MAQQGSAQVWGLSCSFVPGKQTRISNFDSTKSWNRNARSATALCDQRVERVPAGHPDLISELLSKMQALTGRKGTSHYLTHLFDLDTGHAAVTLEMATASHTAHT